MNITAMRLAASDLPSATRTNISTMQRCPNNWCVNLYKKTQHHKTYITNDLSPFTLLSIQITWKLTSWWITVFFFSVHIMHPVHLMHRIFDIHLIHFIHTILLGTSFALITHTSWRALLFFRNGFSQVFEVTFYSNQAKESRFLFSLRS